MTEDQVRDLVRQRGPGFQIELARQAGVSRAFVTNFMRGRKRPSRKILDVLGITSEKTISVVYTQKGACTTDLGGA